MQEKIDYHYIFPNFTSHSPSFPIPPLSSSLHLDPSPFSHPPSLPLHLYISVFLYLIHLLLILPLSLDPFLSPSPISLVPIFPPLNSLLSPISLPYSFPCISLALLSPSLPFSFPSPSARYAEKMYDQLFSSLFPHNFAISPVSLYLFLPSLDPLSLIRVLSILCTPPPRFFSFPLSPPPFSSISPLAPPPSLDPLSIPSPSSSPSPNGMCRTKLFNNYSINFNNYILRAPLR